MNSTQIKNQKLNRNQQGLTLVEVMVAMTIGLILLGGVVTVMSSNQNIYRVNEAVTRMQENARYAFQLLSRDIRMAGYRGCIGDAVAITNVLNADLDDFLWRFDQPLKGYNATSSSWTPDLPSEVTSPLKGRDVIVVRGIEDGYAKVISHASGSADLVVEGDSNIKTGNAVLVSNCLGSAVFKATEVSNVSGKKNVVHAENPGGAAGSNATSNLGKSFTGGEAVRISTRSYYIRTNPEGIPALYWRKDSEKAVELVEGIEDMQIQYGEDVNEDRTAGAYRTADQVVNWENIVSVRIDLLVQSAEDNITSQSQTYTFNGEDVTPTDRRLRQTFSTVIALRNRAL